MFNNSTCVQISRYSDESFLGLLSIEGSSSIFGIDFRFSLEAMSNKFCKLDCHSSDSKLEI
ncbi:hypothetical protein DERP_013256 [Dermatophagoides pteronyssinus]|uniref:Uncharacterized protein n=1 Tax=Dermatophagoides pteronyssinus TaxID=6956 RepID=A0ABQ8IRX4_DERPT|nr:hypothetical protein DERP_013256 [Dermatophagoides pteronyssinus]